MIARSKSRGMLREAIYQGVAITVAVVLPAVLVVRAWDAEVEKAQSVARAAFEARAVQIRDAIAGRLLDYEQVLRGGAGLLAASSRVERDDWRRYFETLRLETSYPGIQSLGYSPHLRQTELAGFIEKVRRSGYPGYTVSPFAERDVYLPVLYIEPFSGRNLRAFGFDAYSDPVRREALERSVDSGLPVMTGRVRLAQEDGVDVQPGVVMYMPVFRGGQVLNTAEQRWKAVEGFVFGHFRVGDLVRRIIGEEQRVALSIYEGPQRGEPIFTNLQNRNHVPLFRWNTDVAILGQTWGLRMESTAYFEEVVDHSTPRLVLLGGSAMHLLLLAMLWSIWKTRDRAMVIARKMTRELRQRELEWQAMSDASPLGIFRAGEDGRLVYVNPRFEVLTGRPAADLLGAGWKSAVHPEDLEAAVKEWEAAVSGQAPEFVGTYRFRQPGGAVLWVMARAAAVYDDEEFAGYVGVAEDVTERRQFTDALLKSRERLGMALEGSNLALFDWDILSGEVRLSEQWQAILGSGHAETVTTIDALQQTVHPDDLPQLQQSLAEVLRGSTPFYEVQHRVRTPNGEWRWILSRAKVTERDEAGQAVRLVGTNADITAGKEIERLKNEFIATVSHELRTPLTAIIGSLALMREVSVDLDPEAKGFLEMAYLNSERLNALINDVLDVEKIGSGQITMDLKPLQLRALLEKALLINRPYADLHGVQLRLLPGDDFCVAVNADRLIQVLTNLLSNAAKFSPAQSEVTVSAERRGDQVRVEVRDQGPGIPESFRGQIFKRFERADNRNTRSKGGTGLGLAISKALIEHMNGTIGFESAEGRGAVFFFELPVAREAQK